VSLKDAVQFALDEARMILPGVQALFGFQLIAAFNQRFDDVLEGPHRVVFLVALILIACACALVMAPAAYHRQVQRGQVSRHLLDLASRLLAMALFALMIAIACDVYLVAWVVTESFGLSIGLAAICLAIYVVLWHAVPRAHSLLRSRVPRSASHV
jgi:hypothetical protein